MLGIKSRNVWVIAIDDIKITKARGSNGRVIEMRIAEMRFV